MQDSTLAVLVTTAGWEARIPALASLLAHRFDLPVSVVEPALREGSWQAPLPLDRSEASSMVEQLAQHGVVATCRPWAQMPPSGATQHVGWGRAEEADEDAAFDGAPLFAGTVLGMAGQGPERWAEPSPAPSPVQASPAFDPRARAASLRAGFGGPPPPVVGESAGAPFAPMPAFGTTRLLDEDVAAAASLAGPPLAPGVTAAAEDPWRTVLGSALDAAPVLPLAQVPLSGASHASAREALPLPAGLDALSAESPASPPVPERVLAEGSPSAVDPAARRWERLRPPEPAVPPAGPGAGDGRRPLLAALASVVAPGAGQAMNHEHARAVTFALSGFLIVPWVLSVQDAWRTAARQQARGLLRPIPWQRVLSTAASFWVLAVLLTVLIRVLVQTVSPAPTPIDALPPPPEPAAPVFVPEPVVEPPPAVDVEAFQAREALRERVVGLVARAQLACQQENWQECRRLAEQALEMDETHRGAHTALVEALSGLSALENPEQEP